MRSQIAIDDRCRLIRADASLDLERLYRPIHQAACAPWQFKVDLEMPGVQAENGCKLTRNIGY